MTTLKQALPFVQHHRPSQARAAMATTKHHPRSRCSSQLFLLAALLLLRSITAFLFPCAHRPQQQGGRAPVRPLAAAAEGGAAAHAIGEVLPERDPTLKVTRVSVEDAAANICGYLVEAEIHGPDVKQAYEIAKKGATLNAAYPGFRKGVIPPHALQDVKINAVTASIMDVCRVAMELHGLENFAVNERPLRMKTPKTYAELAKAYKVGDDLKFACEIDAVGVPGEAKPPAGADAAAAAPAAAAPAT